MSDQELVQNTDLRKQTEMKDVLGVSTKKAVKPLSTGTHTILQWK